MTIKHLNHPIQVCPYLSFLFSSYLFFSFFLSFFLFLFLSSLLSFFFLPKCLATGESGSADNLIPRSINGLCWINWVHQSLPILLIRSKDWTTKMATMRRIGPTTSRPQPSKKNATKLLHKTNNVDATPSTAGGGPSHPKDMPNIAYKIKGR